jgi:hypothetical protein
VRGIWPTRQDKKRTIIIGGLIIILVVAGLITGIAIHAANSRKTTETMILDPGYTTVLPADKSITSLGGWKRVSPKNATPVYAYNDTIAGTAISVSEQTLPESFQDDVNGSIATLAKSYNATAITQVGDTIIYIGTSAKGPQSVIFTKNGLLILIKSEKQITNTAWSSYAVSLQ